MNITRILHPVLLKGGGVPLAEAELSDRQRLAVLFQGACLVSHLRRARWSLPQNWDEALVDGQGILMGVTAQPGMGRRAPQRLLRSLIEGIFGPGTVAGRGDARRAVRELSILWSSPLGALSPDRAVAQIFRQAPFLWSTNYAEVRLAMGAFFEGTKTIGLVGNRTFRRRILDYGSDWLEVQRILSSPRVEKFWRGEGRDLDPAELVREKRWSEALEAWERWPPESVEERLLRARILLYFGRYQAVLQGLKGLRRISAELLRVAALWRSGRLESAANRLHRQRGRSLNPDESLALARVAFPVWRLRADSKGLSRVEKLLDESTAGAETRALLALYRGDLDSAETYLQGMTSQTPQEGWLLALARSRWRAARGEGTKAAQAIGEGLAEFRRQLDRHQAAVLWRELADIRADLLGDISGARKAIHHAMSLLRRVDGTAVDWLAQIKLVDIRTRHGRMRGARTVVERCLHQSRFENNSYTEVESLLLLARLEWSWGDEEKAGVFLRQVLKHRAFDWGFPSNLRSRKIWVARILGYLGERGEAARYLEGLGPVGPPLDPEEIPALWALAGFPEKARAAAETATLTGPLWLAAFDQRSVDLTAVASKLEPLRLARLILDLERVAPGSVSASNLRDAARTFGRTGFLFLAGQIEERLQGEWETLANYLGPTTHRFHGLSECLLGLHLSDARVELEYTDGEVETLYDGPGGIHRWTRATTVGRLVLHTPRVEVKGQVVLNLLAEDLNRRSGVLEEVSLPKAEDDEFVGQSGVFLEALSRLYRLAKSDLTLLLTGESGTGKELAARRAHEQSGRQGGPFQAVNCAAISETLIQSELFGHRKGAFTGADRDRKGILEEAEGGTVFLDEVGDLPPGVQGILLRSLQEKEIRPVGENRPRPIDVRIIAATHRDLEAMVKAGEFRGDLFYRLKVATVKLPPLRERVGDIRLFLTFFLGRLGYEGNSIEEVMTPEVITALKGYSWPGNIRELKHVLEVAAALSEGGQIEREHLDLSSSRSREMSDYHLAVRNFRKQLIDDALKASGGRQAEAARSLGLTRQSLSYLVRSLEVEV